MNTVNRTLWDIETGPLSKNELDAMMPTEWPLGNVKDPVKVAAAIVEKREAWLERAALSALTGQILCIGVLDSTGYKLISGDEIDILKSFWALWTETPNKRLWISFNGHNFDLKFLIRRSLRWNVLPIRIPTKMWSLENSIDLMEVWAMGDRTDTVSLDSLAKFLGFPPKLGKGADFAALWHSDRAKAEEYVQRDVELLEQIAGRMGV